MNETEWYCLTCGEQRTGWGNNPDPIGADGHPEVQDREVCEDCNMCYVIPARMGRHISGPLYDRRGGYIGRFGTVT